MSETISAISTPLQEGAISIIRLSGDEAINIVNKMFSRDLHQCLSHTINYGMIIDEEGNDVDEVLVSVFKAPKTYTTEDVVEINCHGGVFITRKILGLTLANGARIARAGEFTERAFLNGRIDLAQAEAINDMIEANNNVKANQAISSIKGSVRKLIEPLLHDLLQIIAQIEVNIDYPEYDDVEQLSNDVVLSEATIWLKKIDEIINKAKNSYQIKKGIDTAILGKPNVGKSSLLNALLEEDKAIVTNIAGTTRDLVEGVVQLDELTLNLIDTAGIRETDDLVEKIGIKKSLQTINKAELIIIVFDGSKPLDQEDQRLLKLTENKNRIIVYNKKDLGQVQSDLKGITVSAANLDVEELIKEIKQRFITQIHCSSEITLNNERQIALATTAKKQMEAVCAAIEAEMELDLVTIDLQKAYYSLKEILGEVSRSDLLDALFSNFCLGK